MLVRNKILRILRFLGKSVLGLLFLILFFILLIHIPVVQQQLTRSVSAYLTNRLDSRVDIGAIRFSFAGHFSIDDIRVFDPDQNELVYAGKIEVISHITDLLAGNFTFDKIHLAHVKGRLVRDDLGSNIQFILDAFQKEKSQSPSSKEVKLQAKVLELEDITFEYISIADSTSLAFKVDTMVVEDAAFGNFPDRISARVVSIEQPVVNLFYTSRSKTPEEKVLSDENPGFTPDFGLGLGISIRGLVIRDGTFSFHIDTILKTPKFDPSHIDLNHININLTDAVVREDSLAVDLQQLNGHTQDFAITEASAGIQMDQNRLMISGLQLASGTNIFHADITGRHEKSDVPDDHIHAEFHIQSNIHAEDLAYFFNETILDYVRPWGNLNLALDGNYSKGEVALKSFGLTTDHSKLHATGRLKDITELKKLSWKNLMLEAVIGSDFQRTIQSFTGKIKLPPSITLEANTSGTLQKIFMDGKGRTSWGNLKAKGELSPKTGSIVMDLSLDAQELEPGQVMNLPWLGQVDVTMDIKGSLGKVQNAEARGQIHSIAIQDEMIYDISFQTYIIKDSLTTNITVDDPRYVSDIHTDISFADPMMFNTIARFDTFQVGNLMNVDTTLVFSGDVNAKIQWGTENKQVHIAGNHISLRNQNAIYPLDSLKLQAMISPQTSSVIYVADDATGNVVTNFDLLEIPGIVKTWPKNILTSPDSLYQAGGNKKLLFDFNLKKDNLFKVFSIQLDTFSGLTMLGNWNEYEHTLHLEASSGKTSAYGFSLDTLFTEFSAHRDSLTAGMQVNSMVFNKRALGRMEISLLNSSDTILADLHVHKDTSSLLEVRSRFVPTGKGVLIYPDELMAFGSAYHLNNEYPVVIENDNYVFRDFRIARDAMQIRLDGDASAFDITFDHINLNRLNALLLGDTSVISEGLFRGKISYEKDKRFDINANIDSLSLYHSLPISIAFSAATEKNEIPFHGELTNASNKVDMQGRYSLGTKEVDATVTLDVTTPEMFTFLYEDYLDKVQGSIKGEAEIKGPLREPRIAGFLRFPDVDFTTSVSQFPFHIKDEAIAFTHTGLSVEEFTLRDEKNHPLTINGKLSTTNYKNYTYDFNITSDHFTLINTPEEAKNQLKGLLVVGSDFRLSGNENDTYINADVTINDSTALTYVLSGEGDELIKTEGIVEFIDPGKLLDSANQSPSASKYDSLIATLPDFNLNSTINIEDSASLKIIVDAGSGDYIKASGGARLELDYDRTGNLHLAGSYTINKGLYRLSFYELVKKNFNLVPGSTINWSGSPRAGDLDIKAIHTVQSNSIGLVGHEISDSEKPVYKRSLNYEIGINIKGTLEKPNVYFTLDLPAEDKASYPLLANKLDRLKQPEFQSELNKQVFGLLVLGGFLPETSGSDVNSNQIATTALYNSVNSVLSAQLNRFAGQYLKGINVDVGLQSYADYSTPGGKTQTAMDFRVSKSILNDRLSFEVGGDFDLNTDQSGTNTGDNYRGDVAIIYNLTDHGDKQLKLFNNETYDIVYQEIRNTGISLIFIREFNKGEHIKKRKNK